jgi:GNAT superfamily N-acetyltransferase
MIVDATPLHMSQVMAWYWDEWKHDYQQYFDVSTLEAFADRYNATYTHKTYIFLDVNGDVPIGAATVAQDDLGISRPDGLFLANVYVDTSHRNKGVGSALIRHAIR